MSYKMPIQLAFCVFLLLSPLIGSASAAFLAPVAKDFHTGKYMLTVCLRTPPQSHNLVLDLSAAFTSFNCSPSCIPCSSSVCSCGSLSSSHCSDGSYGLIHRIWVNRKPPPTGKPAVDSLSLPVTDGRNPGKLGLIPRFMFSCSQRSSVGVQGSAGLAGLGRSNLSIPAQLSRIASEKPVFALCLSGSPSAPGVAFFGSAGPYYFIPEIDLAKFLNYTPLLPNPVGRRTGNGYVIGLTNIKVNGNDIAFDRTLLAVDDNNIHGAQLSTVTAYTKLRTPIFKALTEAFVKESAAFNLTVTGAGKPFKVCYNADDVRSTNVGPAVPTIDFVLQDDGVFWRIYGANSMVRIFHGGVDLWCLGFLDGGAKARPAVVIGGHQMEDNLVQFDEEYNRIGFSSSILLHGTMCANFNFTTNSTLLE